MSLVPPPPSLPRGGKKAKNYNRLVPRLIAKINVGRRHADDALLHALSGGEGEISRWPTDREFSTFLRTRDVYGTVSAPRLVMALAAVEASLYSGKTDVPEVPGSLSVEHLIPQEWETHWPLTGSDGARPEGGAGPESEALERAAAERSARLHRLGNLTIVARTRSTPRCPTCRGQPSVSRSTSTAGCCSTPGSPSGIGGMNQPWTSTEHGSPSASLRSGLGRMLAAGRSARCTSDARAGSRPRFRRVGHLPDRVAGGLPLSLGKRYAVKRGEDEPSGADGCSVVEAADALACAHHDPSYAVIAKRERGLLLETGEAYYGQLFNRDLSAPEVWHRVLVLRSVDAELAERQRELAGRAKAVAVHGNRLVAHLVFATLRTETAGGDWTSRVDAVPALTLDLLTRLTDQVEARFPDSYVTSLFKNATKCRQLATAVQVVLATSILDAAP